GGDEGGASTFARGGGAGFGAGGGGAGRAAAGAAPPRERRRMTVPSPTRSSTRPAWRSLSNARLTRATSSRPRNDMWFLASMPSARDLARNSLFSTPSSRAISYTRMALPAGVVALPGVVLV